MRKAILSAAVAMAAQWRDSPQVQAALEQRLRTVTKGTVTAGSTLNDLWADALTATGLASEALTVLEGLSVLAALQPRLRPVPFNTPTPLQIGTGRAGGRIVEGAPTPISRFSFDSFRLLPEKFQVVVVVSRDLLKFGDPNAERTLRIVVFSALANTLDTLWLDPAELGSITSGATAITSTGSSAAQITADLALMVAAITTPGTRLTWIMKPTTMAHLALTLAGAAPDLPRTLCGFPVAVSSNSPSQIVLADLNEVAIADEGKIDLDVAEHATLEMEDTPTNSPVVASSPADVIATNNLVNLWQVNSAAFKATRWLSWARVRDGSVVYMTVSY